MAEWHPYVEWDPVEFIAKLATLVPPPRAHLHGVFAPNAASRAELTLSGRGKRLPSNVAEDAPSSITSRSTARRSQRTTYLNREGHGRGRVIAE